MEIKDKLVEAIVKGIQEKKGQDITIADLRGIDGNIANYFVICQGNSPSQVEAIADSVCETARIDAGEKPVHTVGLPQAYWVAMDFVDVSCMSSYLKHATSITLRPFGRMPRL